MNKSLIGVLVAAMVGLVLFLFWSDIQAVFSNTKAAATKSAPNEKAKKKKGKQAQESASPVQIINRWELPTELTEISGMAFLSGGQVACVQDEDGKVFVYNLDSKTITKEVPFAEPGDYEGIALVGTTAYVLRSDGLLFEINGFTGSNPQIKQYRTPLSARQDVEGVAYDEQNKRLLLTIKGEEAAGADYKGVYSFDLSSKRLEATPVFKIQLNDPLFREETQKKVVMQPADIGVHPSTGDLYFVDGARPKLLVMSSRGRLKKLYRLSNTDFPQPEGLSFNKEGELFISNEGRGGRGTILKIALEER